MAKKLSYKELLSNLKGITAVGGFGDSVDLDGEALLAWSDATFTAFFSGDILVGGTSFSAMPASRIDNPLDPANKYFVHASVQSSEMMNIYSGNVTTDELGLATVTLPECHGLEQPILRGGLVREKIAQ